MAMDGAIYPLTISFEKFPLRVISLISAGLRIQGSAGAPRNQLRKMLEFVVAHDIKPAVMTWSMNKKGVEDAMRTLREGKMRYRGVLVVE
jgi:D-arabinose 1-dehydrogenase-like Zn-dependent alcohol dehydrogenase